MNDQTGRHHRRSIRLPGYDYAQAGWYFVTFVTQQRECLLSRIVDATVVLEPAGQAVLDVGMALPERFPTVVLDTVVIMPNHVHAIIGLLPTDAVAGGAACCAPTANATVATGGGAACCAPTAASTTALALGAVLRAWKSLAAVGVNAALRRAGPVWQRNYYEHIIRSERSLERIRQYLLDNPWRWSQDRENPAAEAPERPQAWRY